MVVVAAAWGYAFGVRSASVGRAAEIKSTIEGENKRQKHDCCGKQDRGRDIVRLHHFILFRIHALAVIERLPVRHTTALKTGEQVSVSPQAHAATNENI